MRGKCFERIYNGLKNEQNFFDEQKSLVWKLKSSLQKPFLKVFPITDHKVYGIMIIFSAHFYNGTICS